MTVTDPATAPLPRPGWVRALQRPRPALDWGLGLRTVTVRAKVSGSRVRSPGMPSQKPTDRGRPSPPTDPARQEC